MPVRCAEHLRCSAGFCDSLVWPICWQYYILQRWQPEECRASQYLIKAYCELIKATMHLGSLSATLGSCNVIGWLAHPWVSSP